MDFGLSLLVARRSEGDGARLLIGTLIDIPDILTADVAPRHDVGFAVAVVIAVKWRIGSKAPLQSNHLVIGASQNVKNAIASNIAINRYILCAVAVKIERTIEESTVA